MDNSLRDAKVVNDMMFYEFDHVRRFYFLQGDGFLLFGEVISYNQDEPMSFRCWRAYGANDVHSSHLKWP